MRSNPADYELIAPGKLQAVVSLLADAPGQWLPIAGGTDVMVQYAAGKLPAPKAGQHLEFAGTASHRDFAGGNQDWRRMYLYRTT